MKRILTLVIISALALTACKNANKTSESNSSDSVEYAQAEITDIAAASGEYNQLADENADVDNFIQFDSIKEFEEYAQKGDFSEIFPEDIYPEGENSARIDEGFAPFVPKYDEQKYEEKGVMFVGTEYTYLFENRETGEGVTLYVDKDTYYHDYEGMVESLRGNLVMEAEDMQATIWGDTPALVQEILFTSPTEYSINAMIDENNMAGIRASGKTPDELVCLFNEFSF